MLLQTGCVLEKQYQILSDESFFSSHKILSCYNKLTNVAILQSWEIYTNHLATENVISRNEEEIKPNLKG